MSVRVIRRYDGPHRCEGMLVEAPSQEWYDANILELLGSPIERALWSEEYLTSVVARDGAAPTMLWLLRRVG